MKNIAVIFAGGTGTRMRTADTPKQFLTLQGRPVIIRTLEIFENTPGITDIIVCSHPDWIDTCRDLIDRAGLRKVRNIVAGGASGQQSIYNGLRAAAEVSDSEQDVVVIHDGVRPLVSPSHVQMCVDAARAHGSAVTAVPAKETVAVRGENGGVGEIVDRTHVMLVRAPQCFFLHEILEAHNRAISESRDDFVDSATMMHHYGAHIHLVEGSSDNIKITTQDDYFAIQSILSAREIQQLIMSED